MMKRSGAPLQPGAVGLRGVIKKAVSLVGDFLPACFYWLVPFFHYFFSVVNVFHGSSSLVASRKDLRWRWVNQPAAVSPNGHLTT